MHTNFCIDGYVIVCTMGKFKKYSLVSEQQLEEISFIQSYDIHDIVKFIKPYKDNLDSVLKELERQGELFNEQSK